MTRMRGGKSDWDTFSPKRRRLSLTTLKALHGGTESLTVEELRELESKDAPRARAMQVEDQHARILAARVYRHWWSPGFHRWEHRTANWREAEERVRQGAQTGMPDFWLFVPQGPVCGCVHSVDCVHTRKAVCAVCELKVPHLSPKREVTRRWWLGEWPGEQQSWHGLRKDQWQRLRELEGCGFQTMVAYGADEALAFFVECAGPKPDVLPAEWGE